jgi:long-subunit fatty acid transport protein
MKKPLKWGLFSVLGLCLGSWFYISFSWAQGQTVVELPSSPNPVGSGARALGMGGAFIAVADDATAATWNPGGLIQLEMPEISSVISGALRFEDKSFANNPEASGSDKIDDFNINYLSAVYPFSLLEHNMVVSLNYQHLYDFNRDWKFNFIYPQPTIYDGPARYEYEQRGALYALGLAYCIQITRSLSVGVTLNYWGDFVFDNKWEQNYNHWARFNIAGIPALYSNIKKEEYDFEGWNANLGFLFRINEHITIGGVFKTPFKADIKHTISEEDRTEWPTLGQVDIFSSTKNYNEELEIPMSYGIGLAVRFTDAFTASADVYRTHWEDYALTDHLGVKKSPISQKTFGDSEVEATTWFRAGAEYLIIGKKVIVPLRAGVFYDPAPAEGSPDDFYGFSIGSGLAYKRFIFDIAYQFRFGNDVSGCLWQEGPIPMDVQEHKIYCSLIVHF